MEGLFWGVMAMVVKDTLKQQYIKGRDYERNVRQVYRDVDNLKITMAHVRTNCQPEDLETGPHALFIQRAERQLHDAYRMLKKHYPRTASTSRLMEYSSTPGAEMHLLDIGKEANQTARGLGDLLAEIRFAKIGKAKAGDEKKPPADGAQPIAAPPARHSMSSEYDMALYEHAIASSPTASSPRSMASDASSLFDHPHVRPSSIHSPSSSISSTRHSSRRRRSHSASNKKHDALPPTSSRYNSRPLDAILESGQLREHALDNLQYRINHVKTAPEDEDDVAMEKLERALAEVLRLQKAEGGFAGGSQADEDLGDAVEDLDDAMNELVGARGEKERKYALKRLSHALEDVDSALSERQRIKKEEDESLEGGRRQRRMSNSPSKGKKSHSSSSSGHHTHGSLRRKQESRERSRRYSTLY